MNSNYFNSNCFNRIVKFPHDLLYNISMSVVILNFNIINIIQKLFFSIRFYRALGLSSIQIGSCNRIILIELYGNKNLLDNKKYFGACVMLNPEIIGLSFTSSEYSEGCLSFKSLFFKVKRFRSLIVKYFNIFGDIRFFKISSNIIVSCILHEIDHINGILFLNRVSRLKRSLFFHKYTNLNL